MRGSTASLAVPSCAFSPPARSPRAAIRFLPLATAHGRDKVRLLEDSARREHPLAWLPAFPAYEDAVCVAIVLDRLRPSCALVFVPFSFIYLVLSALPCLRACLRDFAGLFGRLLPHDIYRVIGRLSDILRGISSTCSRRYTPEPSPGHSPISP